MSRRVSGDETNFDGMWRTDSGAGASSCPIPPVTAAVVRCDTCGAPGQRARCAYCRTDLATPAPKVGSSYYRDLASIFTPNESRKHLGLLPLPDPSPVYERR